jgi:EAL domain-containing protein (putative c-di-GMP-specific phosphodiesterase class I)
VELELLAVRTALAALDDLPPGVDLSINASPATVRSVAFASLLRHHPAPQRIVLELTEHSEVLDYGALADALRVLRDLGIRLAVDDAGAGYASLRHILTLRPDVIKLDRTLITNLPLDSVRRALVRAMVLFADDIGAVIVGEGIETEAEYAALRDLGVGQGQGYHIARPAALPLPAGVLDHLPAPV